MDQPADHIEAFIARWQHADGRERANYQLFLTELAALLDLPRPEPAGADDRDNAYAFERRVDFRHGDGSETYGYIDLYRRGCFVLEAKDVRESSDRRYDDTMLRARSQAENYARVRNDNIPTRHSGAARSAESGIGLAFVGQRNRFRVRLR